jgi:hypothetical protein
MPYDVSRSNIPQAPYSFPKFNPGVTLTSAPYRPTQQVIGDPANVVKQIDIAAALAPPPPPPVAPAARNRFIGGAMDPYFQDNYGRGGRTGGGYTTSTGMAQGGWGRTSTGQRSSAFGGKGGLY